MDIFSWRATLAGAQVLLSELRLVHRRRCWFNEEDLTSK
jgi:hypothetical protein